MRFHVFPRSWQGYQDSCHWASSKFWKIRIVKCSTWLAGTTKSVEKTMHDEKRHRENTQEARRYWRSIPRISSVVAFFSRKSNPRVLQICEHPRSPKGRCNLPTECFAHRKLIAFVTDVCIGIILQWLVFICRCTKMLDPLFSSFCPEMMYFS